MIIETTFLKNINIKAQALISKENLKKFNVRITRTLIMGLIGGFSLMFFGGLGYFTKDKFGIELLFLDGMWFQTTMVVLGSLWMGLVATWWTWTKFFRVHVPLQYETRAISLASVGLGTASIVAAVWQITFVVMLTNQVVIDTILPGGMSQQHIDAIWQSITFLIIASSLAFGIYWYVGKKYDSPISRHYHWIRNSIMAMGVSAFLLYNQMLSGLGAWGLDLTNILNYVAEKYNVTLEEGTELLLAGIWTNLDVMQQTYLAGFLNHLFPAPEPLFEVGMSGELFASTLMQGGRLDIFLQVIGYGNLIDLATTPKNWFFGVNNNWHGYLILMLTLGVTFLPIIFLLLVWFKVEFEVHNGKETVLRTIAYVLIVVSSLYAFDNYIIYYIAPLWNPSAHNNTLNLFARDYYGTPYWWTMFTLLLLVPTIIVNIPIMKWKYKIKKAKKI